MKILKNDKVKIIKGKDKGKEGKVLFVSIDTKRVLVEGLNMVKKHVKPGTVSKEGGIINIEKPLNISKVMIVCGKCALPTRVGYSITGNKKYRVCKRCGEILGKIK